MSISKEAVIYGFKFFLGRDILDSSDAENVVKAHMKIKSEEDLAKILIRSKEFKEGNRLKSLFESTSDSHAADKQGKNINVAILGNCQSQRLAELISAMVPELSTQPIHLTEINVSKAYNNEYSTILNRAQHIILLTHPQENFSKFIIDTHGSHKVSHIPIISFAGFQPDNDYIHIIDNKQSFINKGPLNDYQSLLTFWGWKNGFSARETKKLFCSDVFSRIGYYDFYYQSQCSLLKSFNMYPYPLEQAYMKWRSRGCFMHSVNHPKLFVLADLARFFLKKHNYDVAPEVETYLPDPFTSHGCWPVYPEIGERLSINGSYHFKRAGEKPVFISLLEFIKQSFHVYSEHLPHELDNPRLHTAAFKELLPFAKSIVSKSKNHVIFGWGNHSLEILKKIAANVATAMDTDKTQEPQIQEPQLNPNPYKDLPDHCFWKRAVAAVPRDALDPVVSPGFGVGTRELVATAGSCFAQHIAKRLAAEGFNYYIPESGDGLTEKELSEQNYGVFSCRYGNLYTTRQLVQLFDRSMGRFTPKDNVWQRAGGRYVDPFRPQIDPAGFDSVEAVENSRNKHLDCVKEMFEKLDILVFTLGLTESWESLEDGSIYPLAPGVAGGVMDPSIHRFRNFTAKEVADDLELFLLKLQSVNPKARVILTVSPVPLIATYENRHVLVSNTHSKAVLRTVAGETATRYEHCDYFPSYEIITGQHVGNGYLEDDLRSVRPEGVDHVMRVFLKHYAGKEVVEHQESQREKEQKAAIERINDVICDEEAIDS